MKFKALVATLAGVLVGAVAFAAPSHASTTIYAHDSTGGSYVYIEYTDVTITVTVCDTKPDGHHAHAEVQRSDDGGAWVTVHSGDEYNGNGTCAFVYGVSVGCPHNIRYRAWALTYEGSTPIGTRGYTTPATMC